MTTIFGESLKVYKRLNELDEDIKEYRKKYEEEVEASLDILSNLKSRFNDNLVRNILLDQRGEVESLLESTKERVELLRLFAPSEIVHRRLQEIRFRLTNPFFFGKSKIEFKEILYKIKDLESSSLKKKYQEIVLGYDNLIEKTSNLEGRLGEERKSGLINYLKWLIPGVSGWTAAFLMYLNMYVVEQEHAKFWVIVLWTFFILLFIVPVFLLNWNYFSYGVGYLGIRKAYSTFFILFALLAVGSFLISFLISDSRVVMAQILQSLLSAMLAAFLLVFSQIMQLASRQREALLEEDIKKLVGQFGFSEYYSF